MGRRGSAIAVGSTGGVAQSPTGCGLTALRSRNRPWEPRTLRHHRRADPPRCPRRLRARRGASTRTSSAMPNTTNAAPTKACHPMPRSVGRDTSPRRDSLGALSIQSGRGTWPVDSAATYREARCERHGEGRAHDGNVEVTCTARCLARSRRGSPPRMRGADPCQDCREDAVGQGDAA
jgi:hypothetical protein